VPGSRIRIDTAWIEFGPKPAHPAPNTLCTGGSPVGQFWYRVYVPDAGRNAKGWLGVDILLDSEDGAALHPQKARGCSS
jgi:hypothetical protein